MKNKLRVIYSKLHSRFGPQHWWPGETPFEVAVGAVLMQNTNWGNVEKAIGNIRSAGALHARTLHEMPCGKLAGLIKPAGYFNIKAKRLKNFINLLTDAWGGSMKRMARGDLPVLRTQLLGVNGIGPETADSILLYALGKPVFVIDAYTKRVLSRHNIMRHDETYEAFQELFHVHLPKDADLFNEYHALFVRVAKEHCRIKPLCTGCPLDGV